jgi:carbon monoxide dehydrogenase subunit G
MGTVTASASASVPAPPDKVIDFLSDLSARPQILTGNYTAFTVEDDGFAYHFAAGGRERDYRLKSVHTDAAVTEQDELSSFVNTWQVVPAGAGSTVTLTGTWDGAGGIGGIFEGLFAPLGLKRIYTEVLANLARAISA